MQHHYRSHFSLSTIPILYYNTSNKCVHFCSTEVEGQFLADVAQRRWPVLIFIFCFDVGCYVLRLLARLVASVRYGFMELVSEMGPQLANMACCYLVLGLVNARSRRLGDLAARQVRPSALQYICQSVLGTRASLTWNG